MAWSRRRATGLRIPSSRQTVFASPGAAYPPPLIQKRFISHISHVETETLNLILDPPGYQSAGYQSLEIANTAYIKPYFSQRTAIWSASCDTVRVLRYFT